MDRCIGCGAILQSDDKLKDGYTSNLQNKLCERCFRIRNYNEQKAVVKDSSDYIDILKNIGQTDDLVLLVVDLFNFFDLNKLKDYINNDIILVLTKRDLLPSDIYEERILDYFNLDMNIKDKIIISSQNNYHLDTLYKKINQYKKSKNVYVIGYTSAGKSTLINKMIYNYSNLDSYLTTSYLPTTTLDMINIPLNDDLNLIDTPGLLVDGNILELVDKKIILSFF